MIYHFKEINKIEKKDELLVKTIEHMNFLQDRLNEIGELYYEYDLSNYKTSEINSMKLADNLLSLLSK